MRLILLTLTLLKFNFFFGQNQKLISKPAIDTSVFSTWPSLGSAMINDDGTYVLYTIENQPKNSRTLIIQNVADGSKMEIPNGSSVLRSVIAAEGKKVLFTKSKDTLGIATLGQSNIDYIPNVSSFKVSKEGYAKWAAYLLKNARKELIVRNLVTNKEKIFTQVRNYIFTEKGNILLLETDFRTELDTVPPTLIIHNLSSEQEISFTNVENYLLSPDGSTLILLMKENGEKRETLHWVNLSKQTVTEIWEGKNASNLLLDQSGSQLAFIAPEKEKRYLWYYNLSMKNPVMLNTDSIPNIDSSFKMGFIYGFNRNPNLLFFTFTKKVYFSANPDGIELNIWSYRDTKLLPQQLKEGNQVPVVLVAFNPSKNKFIQLNQENEAFLIHNIQNSDIVLVSKHERGRAGLGEGNWNIAARRNIYVVSTLDGKRKVLSENTLLQYTFSPTGKYLIYYDPTKKNYLSYSIKMGVVRNITATIKTAWEGYDKNEQSEAPYGLYQVGGWLSDDRALLIYDEYDIWQVDPTGTNPPICLTNSHGREKKIVFRLAISHLKTPIENKEKLLLIAYDKETKANGFYSKVIGTPGDPKLLSMGQFIYYIPGINLSTYGVEPLKALKSETFIVQRMSSTESPNYFATTDFKKFIPLSNIQPQKSINWMTTELYRWNGLDGTPLKGILYKPENFNPGKKYPIIFYCYERFSDALNAFLNPDFSDGRLNIPWFVSNDYLVFTPDISYKIGFPGECAYNSVKSAAQYLAKFPFINSKKMGIQGISFGGFETNYLITHTNIFAAACSSSGESDFISGYGGLIKELTSRKVLYEVGQNRIGATLWERPDLYIKNSPIFHADKVSTPLLMMHTSIDDVVPFSQSIEFFTSLRRLGKKVWMLEYKDGNHTVWGKSAVDFSLRMFQFFNHYLKDTPAPKWMLYNNLTSMQGMDDNGLELIIIKDRNDQWLTPKDGGLLTDEEKVKMKVLKNK